MPPGFGVLTWAFATVLGRGPAQSLWSVASRSAAIRTLSVVLRSEPATGRRDGGTGRCSAPRSEAPAPGRPVAGSALRTVLHHRMDAWPCARPGEPAGCRACRRARVGFGGAVRARG